MIFLLKYFISLCLFVLTSAQGVNTIPKNVTEIFLNTDVVGTIGKDEGSAFFKLIIPNTAISFDQELVFKINEPENAQKGLEDFSDPDVYITSKVEFFH